MLVKIDSKLAKLIVEDREDLIAQLQRSSRMYSWVKGEDIGHLIDNFAAEHRQATMADLMNWSKATYLDRVRARNKGQEWTDFSWVTEHEQVRRERRAKFEDDDIPVARPGVSVIGDAVSATRKAQGGGANSAPPPSQPRADLKKVAEPGDEPSEATENAQEEGAIPKPEDMAHLTASTPSNPFGPRS